MDLKLSVWSVMQQLKLDELICTKTDRKSFLRKFIPRSKAYKHEKFEHPISPNLKILIDRGDYTQWRVFSGRLFVNKHIFEYLKIDDKAFTMFDIGANIGAFTVLFSEELKIKDFTVHLFEPNPGIMGTLQENVKRLEKSNRSVHATIAPYALGEKEDVLPLKVDEEHTGLATLGVPGTFSHSVNVKVIPLDSYVEENKVQRLDFVKIDVESYEPGVLNGARKMLATFRPVLYMEYSREWFENFSDDYIADLLNHLKTLGYRFYRESRSTELMDLPMTIQALKEYQHLNILAVCK